MINAKCHCGAISLSVPDLPENLGRCNCSICSRLGSLWAYYPSHSIDLTAANEVSKAYVWGDKMLNIHHCPTCGCTTHWSNRIDPSAPKIGVNARMFEDIDISNIPLREIDGASF